jgi:uncharacterized lipoprotein YbaY
MPTHSCNATSFFRALVVAAAAAVALAACQPVQRPDANVTTAPAPVHPGADAALIHARATYLERILAPAGATLDVQLIEEGLDAEHTRVLVTQQASNLHGPPFAFDIPYDATRISADARYGIRASLRDADGKLQFATDALVPVVPGSAATVEFRLVRTNIR